MIAHSSSRDSPWRSSTSWCGPEEIDALAGDRLSDEDPHAPAPAAAGVTIPNDSSAATWAAATAAPGPDRAPGRDRRELERAHRAEDLLDRDRAEVAEPEDLAGQLALAAGQDEAAPLELAVERLPVEVVGHDGRGDRLRGDGAGRRTARSRGRSGRPATRRRTPRDGRRRLARPRRSSGGAPRRPGRRRRSPG